MTTLPIISEIPRDLGCIVLFGIQGSGKGTQGKLLSDHMQVPHISTGELLRNLANETDPLSQRITSTINSGNYIDDATMTELLQARMPSAVILDGYPRTLAQANSLDTIAYVNAVLYLSVPENVVIERLNRRFEKKNRVDDSPEKITRRLEQYYANEKSILNYYRDTMRLLTIDADRPENEVHQSIVENLQSYSHFVSAREKGLGSLLPYTVARV